jgi:hypothetical protein
MAGRAAALPVIEGDERSEEMELAAPLRGASASR